MSCVNPLVVLLPVLVASGALSAKTVALWPSGEEAAARELELVAAGQPAERVIVIPAAASPVEKYAADELQDYLARATGVKLPIASENEPLPARAILLGATKHAAALLGMTETALRRLGDDGFRLAVRGPHVIAYGSPKRGALYAAYEMLEKFAHCRWYASWMTVVPKASRIVLPADYDDTQVPDFVMRCPWWYDVIRHNDFAARLRVNTRPWGTMEEKYGGDAFKFCAKLQSCHTFDTLLPPAKYRKEHPEYFSRVGGERTQPCLSNSEVLAIVTSNVLEHIRRDPAAKAYGVSQNDWYNYCTCAKCAAIDAEEGSHAGTLVRFVNAVADVVAKEFPDKVVETLAYQYTRQPPAKTKLRANVVPCLCTIECDFSRPIPESPFREDRSFLHDIEGWRETTDQLYVWDYTVNFSDYPLSFANAYSLQDNLRFFRTNRVKEIFEQGAYQGSLADFAELKAWLLAKWMWNADLPVEALLDDFFTGFYGPAAPYVREYFETLHALQRTISADPKKPLCIYQKPNESAIPDEFYAFADALFDRARAATATADPVYGRNVRREAFSVDYTRFRRLTDREPCLLHFGTKGPDASAAECAWKLARRLQATLDEVKDARLAESETANASRFKRIRECAAKPPEKPVRVTRGFVEERDLRFCRDASKGAIVDDPKAEDGHALKLFTTHYEWSTAMPFSRIVTDPGQKLLLRVRCRVEKKSVPRKGEAIWMGVYDWKKNAGVIERDVAVESIASDDYVWYDVGTFTPADAQTFWIGPGRFGKDGQSNIQALFVDKIELSLAD